MKVQILTLPNFVSLLLWCLWCYHPQATDLRAVVLLEEYALQ